MRSQAMPRAKNVSTGPRVEASMSERSSNSLLRFAGEAALTGGAGANVALEVSEVTAVVIGREDSDKKDYGAGVVGGAGGVCSAAAEGAEVAGAGVSLGAVGTAAAAGAGASGAGAEETFGGAMSAVIGEVTEAAGAGAAGADVDGTGADESFGAAGGGGVGEMGGAEGGTAAGGAGAVEFSAGGGGAVGEAGGVGGAAAAGATGVPPREAGGGTESNGVAGVGDGVAGAAGCPAMGKRKVMVSAPCGAEGSAVGGGSVEAGSAVTGGRGGSTFTEDAVGFLALRSPTASCIASPIGMCATPFA